MNPSYYTVQEHIAELRRIAAQERLAREVRQPVIFARWLNRLFAALRRHDQHLQPEQMPAPRAAMSRPVSSGTGNPGATLPELCIDEAWC